MGAATGSAAPLISMKMKGMVGDGAPLGFFDPLGFSKDATPEKMKMCVSATARINLRLARRRPRSERGLPCFRTRRLWPSEPSSSCTADSTSLFPRVFEKFSSNPLEALTQCPKLGWLQILTFIMFIEVLGIINSRRPDYEPGNFLGTSQWGLEAGNDFGWDSYQTKELNNGRLAMFGAIGMLAGSYITGKGPLEVMTGGGTVVF
jgi:hypothetical protein